MATIIDPVVPVDPEPAWKTAGETVVTIALDRNEVVAIRDAVYRNYKATDDETFATSLNGAGARVYEALQPLVEKNDWC